MGGPPPDLVINPTLPPLPQPDPDHHHQDNSVERDTYPPKENRHVQWSQDGVVDHVSVQMDLAVSRGEGGQQERKEKRGEASEASSDLDYRIDDIPSPVDGGGNEEERARAPVFVDEREENGLPTEEEVEGKAKGIMTAYTTGLKGLWETSLRRRPTKKEGEETGEDEGAGANRRIDEEEEDDHVGVIRSEPAPTTAANLGILTALMALQQQEAELASSLPNSTTSSANPTPAPSTPGSPTLSDTDNHQQSIDDFSDDDEYEREKFIAKLRAKRATKNSLHVTSNVVTNVGKSAAKGGFHFATGGHFRGGTDRGRNLSASGRAHSTSTLRSLAEESPSRSKASSLSDQSSSRALSPHRSHPDTPLESVEGRPPQRSHSASSLAQHHRSRSATSLAPTLTRERARPSSTSLHKLISRSSSPSPPPSPGIYVPYQARFTTELSKQVRKLGDRLGLELETERTRPSAARSGGGVFAGLIASTVSLDLPSPCIVSSF